MKIDPRIKEIVFTHQQIVEKSRELGKWVDDTYQNSENLIIVGLMKGSIPFLAELIKHISVDHILDFMTVASFHGGVKSSEEVKIVTDLKSDIQGKDVLIVEEIIDSGRTLLKIVKHLTKRQPKSLKILTLLDKRENRQVKINADKYGFIAPNAFYAGFGLDVKEKLRNLPYIGIFDQSKLDKL